MSRIWDALQQIETQRKENALEFIVPDRFQLTPKQRLAIQALLQTDSIAEAARMTGVAEMTMRRWLTRPGFITAFYHAGREQLERDKARLDAVTENTIDKLRRAREMLARLGQVAGDLRRAARGATAVERSAPGAELAHNGDGAPPCGEDEAAGGR